MRNRFQLFIICMVGFLDHVSIGLVYPIFAAMLFDGHANLLPASASNELRGLLFGLLIGMTPIVQFFFSPILGALSDKVGRKKILQIGVGTGAIGYLVAIVGILTGSITLLLTYRALVGISDGTAAVAQAAISDISTEENKTRNFSIFNGAMGFGFTIGPFLGGILSDPTMDIGIGYVTPFLVTGVMTAINFLLVTFKYPDTSTNTKPTEASQSTCSIWDGIYNLKRAFHWKGLRIYFAASFAFAFGWAYYSEFIPITLMDQFSFGTAEIGQYFAYNGIWYGLSAGILTAPFLRRFAPEKLVIKSLLISAVFMPLFVLIDNPLYLLGYTPILMFLMALVFPTMSALVSNKTAQDRQGEVLGVYQSVSAIAFGLSPLCGGTIIAAYPMMTIWGGAFLMLVAGLVLLRGEKASKQQLPLKNSPGEKAHF